MLKRNRKILVTSIIAAMAFLAYVGSLDRASWDDDIEQVRGSVDKSLEKKQLKKVDARLPRINVRESTSSYLDEFKILGDTEPSLKKWVEAIEFHLNDFDSYSGRSMKDLAEEVPDDVNFLLFLNRADISIADKEILKEYHQSSKIALVTLNKSVAESYHLLVHSSEGLDLFRRAAKADTIRQTNSTISRYIKDSARELFERQNITPFNFDSASDGDSLLSRGKIDFKNLTELSINGHQNLTQVLESNDRRAVELQISRRMTSLAIRGDISPRIEEILIDRLYENPELPHQKLLELIEENK